MQICFRQVLKELDGKPVITDKTPDHPGKELRLAYVAINALAKPVQAGVIDGVEQTRRYHLSRQIWKQNADPNACPLEISVNDVVLIKGLIEKLEGVGALIIGQALEMFDPPKVVEPPKDETLKL